MLLKDAIRRAEALVADLPPADAVAIHALIETARRVHRLQKPLRDLHRALLPDELTQVGLFPNHGDSDGSES
jgi:hypothetical protein